MKTSVSQANDFADWLSPILVKELRQGLRTKVFTGTFIGLQILLIVCVGIGLTVAANGDDTAGSSVFFWILVALPLLVVLPGAGLNAVAGETRAGTLELIFLTRLSAWRILFGKWIAIVAQSTLFLAAVLPYVVLRYFMGGVDLAWELMIVALLLAISAILSAVAVGLSAYPVRLVRVTVLVLTVLGLPFGLMLAMVSLYSPVPLYSMAAGGGYETLLIVLGILVLVALLMLEFGAARIAPQAESYAPRKRLLGVLILGAGWLGWALEPKAGGIAAVAFVAVIPILIGAMCEEPVAVSSIYRPFVRCGLFGRLVGRFLYPGWPSGLLYCLALLGGFAALFVVNGASGPSFQAAAVAFPGALFVPIAVIRLTFRGTRRVLAGFIIFQLLAGLLGFAVRIIDQVSEAHVLDWLAFIPTCTLMGLWSDGITLDASRTIVLGGAALGFSLIGLFVGSIPPWRTLSALERQSLAESAAHERVD